jgi:hypothetical protein
MTREEKVRAFRALHERPGAFVIPNPWDAGTARILTALGFEALATTSAGYAFSVGRLDSSAALTREEILANAKAIVEATVSAIRRKIVQRPFTLGQRPVSPAARSKTRPAIPMRRSTNSVRRSTASRRR